MFGKPQWFRAKTLGWGLVPIRWQGWGYTASWAAAIGLPFMLLVGRHQPLEATAWLGISLSALVFDVRQILRALGQSQSPAVGVAAAEKDDGVLYILDSHPGKPVATRNYNLQVRA